MGAEVSRSPSFALNRSYTTASPSSESTMNPTDLSRTVSPSFFPMPIENTPCGSSSTFDVAPGEGQGSELARGGLLHVTRAEQQCMAA